MAIVAEMCAQVIQRHFKWLLCVDIQSWYCTAKQAVRGFCQHTTGIRYSLPPEPVLRAKHRMLSSIEEVELGDKVWLSDLG